MGSRQGQNWSPYLCQFARATRDQFHPSCTATVHWTWRRTYHQHHESHWECWTEVEFHQFFSTSFFFFSIGSLFKKWIFCFFIGSLFFPNRVKNFLFWQVFVQLFFTCFSKKKKGRSVVIFFSCFLFWARPDGSKVRERSVTQGCENAMLLCTPKEKLWRATDTTGCRQAHNSACYGKICVLWRDARFSISSMFFRGVVSFQLLLFFFF